jgi:AraC-like DNA-binding protein
MTRILARNRRLRIERFRHAALHSTWTRMATLVPPVRNHPTNLIASGQLWLPRASLTACLRATMVRNTVGHQLSDEQRINRFPASPLCSLTWWFEGRTATMVASQPGRMAELGAPLEALPGRWVLGGPQTRPCSSWSSGPVYGMMVIFLPDALHLLTGLEPSTLTNRFVDAESVLPPDWIDMCDAVQRQPSDADRLACLEAFLEPRWQACRPALPLQANRYADWAAYLAQRAAVSGPGRSLRQLERRIKQWAGLPMRELRGLGRAEQAFFAAVTANLDEGHVNWADLAADAGYADQPHLCREARRITGFSPQALYEGIQTQEAFWAYRIWV